MQMTHEMSSLHHMIGDFVSKGTVCCIGGKVKH